MLRLIMFFNPFIWLELIVGYFNREYKPIQPTKPLKFRLGQYSKDPGMSEYPSNSWIVVQTDGWWAPEEGKIYYLSVKKDVLTISKDKSKNSVLFQWPDVGFGQYRETGKLAWKHFCSNR